MAHSNTKFSARKQTAKYGRFMISSALTAAALVAYTGQAHASGPWTEWDTQNNFTYNSDGTNTTINTTANRAGGDSRDLDIDAHESVRVNQISSDALFYARAADDADPTEILGSLSSNGRLLIIDRNGVFFGANSRVDVAGLIATTGDISNKQIMSNDFGKYTIENLKGAGDIVMNGQMTIAEGGLAAFVAPTVRNNGIITAKLGKVVFASGEKVTLDLYGDKLVEIEVAGDDADALLENTGKIVAEGGHIQISAASAKQAVDNIINVEGVVTAASATMKGGKIVLSGGDAGVVKVAGKVDASGTDGGEIKATGQNIQIDNTAELDISGGKGEDKKGNGGTAYIYGNQYAILEGSILGRGGDEEGNGGNAELSAGDSVGLSGLVNLGANNGAVGTFLIDPEHIVLSDTIGVTPGALTVWDQALAYALTNSDVNLWATETISTISDIDISRHSYETVDVLGHFSSCGFLCWEWVPTTYKTNHILATNDLTLAAPQVNLKHDIIIGTGALNASDILMSESVFGLGWVRPLTDILVGTLNLDSKIYTRSFAEGNANTLASDGQINTTADTINVLSNKASIQQAIHFVDGSDSDVEDVNIAAGTYEEQININKTLNLIGAGQGKTIIASPASLANNYLNNKGVVFAHDAENINISSLTVDGQGNGNGNSRMFGILYKDASGTVDDVHVTNIIETPFSGNQHGVAIQNYNTDGIQRTWTVQNSTIDNFQKNGVTANGEGLTANIVNNIITGAGATSVTAQNGIQISRGATGLVQGNTISGIGYIPSSWSASSILAYDAGAGLIIDGNTINGTGLDIGVSIVSSENIEITNNTIDGSGVGVLIDSGNYEPYLSWGATGNSDGAKVTNNEIIHTADIGVWSYDVSNILINKNTISGQNGSDTSVIVDGGVDTRVVSNDMEGFTTGVSVSGATAAQVNYNTISVLDDGIVYDNSKGAILGNTITGAGATSDETVNGIMITDSDTSSRETVNISRNTITGFGEGIDVVDAQKVNITQNFINGNHEGVSLGKNADGSIVKIFENDLSGNTTFGVENRSGEIVNASFNWWGSTDEATVVAYINPENGGVDISPYLGNGTDTDASTRGFQADFSSLYVTDEGAQTSGLIQEGIDATTVGGTLYVNGGLYTESIIIDKALKLAGMDGATLETDGLSKSLITVTAADVNIDPITFDGLGLADYGINATGLGANNIVVDSNTFKGFNKAGIYLATPTGATTGTIINNTFEGSSTVGIKTGDLNNGYALTIKNNTIGSDGDEVKHGIVFDRITSAQVNITKGTIHSDSDGILFSEGTHSGADVNIVNAEVYSKNDEGIDFQKTVHTGSTVAITGTNGRFVGGGNGIEFAGINGNVTISDVNAVGLGSDKRGINLLGAIKGNLTLDGANVYGDYDAIGSNDTQANAIDGGKVTINGGFILSGKGDGIEFGTIKNGGSFSYTGASLFNEILSEDAGIRFAGNVESGSSVTINTPYISSENNGIVFDGDVKDASSVNISGGNGLHVGDSGIVFNGNIEGGSTVDINNVKVSTLGITITNDAFATGGLSGAVNTVGIPNTKGGDAIRFAGIDGSTVNVENSQLSASNGNAIIIDGELSGNSTISIANNTVTQALDGSGILIKDATFGGVSAEISVNTIDKTGSNALAVYNLSNAKVLNNKIGTNGGALNINGDGIFANTSAGVQIKGNTIENTESQGVINGSGIHVRNSDNAVIGGAGSERNIINNVEWDGINVTGGDNVTIDNNKITNVDQSGVYVESLTNSKISNNIIDTSVRGIRLSGGSNLSVSTNNIQKTDLEGIYASYTANTNIVGNTVKATGLNGNYDGISSNSDNNISILSNNILATSSNQGATRHGIGVFNGSSALIQGNNITGSNGSSGQGKAGAAADGIHVENNSGVEVLANNIKGGNGRSFSSSKGGNGAGQYGIYVTGSSNADILGNKILGGDNGFFGGDRGQGAGADGIRVTGSNGAEIDNNTVQHVLGNGIYLNPSHNAVIRNNVISGAGLHGIHVLSSNNVDILSNTIGDGVVFGASEHGIYVNGGRDVLIDDNTIQGATGNVLALGAGQDGIHVVDNREAVITNNKIMAGSALLFFPGGVGAGQYGIYVENSGAQSSFSARDGVVVSGNNVIGTGLLSLGSINDGIHVIGGSGGAIGDSASVDSNTVKYVGGNGIYVDGTHGARINTNNVSLIGKDGIQVTNADIIQVNNNVVSSTFGHGVNVLNADMFAVNGNTVSLAALNGINVDGSYAGKINDNSVAGSLGNGIRLNASDLVSIADNTVTSAGVNGIQVEGGNGVSISGNGVTLAGNDGINVNGTVGLSVEDNVVTRIGDDGIDLVNVLYFNVSGNIVGASADDGIQIRNAALGSVNDNFVILSGNNGIDTDYTAFTNISDNTVMLVAGNGIKVSNALLADISGNTILLTGNDGINVARTLGSTIENNTVALTGGDGIDVEDSWGASIRANTVAFAAENGIEFQSGGFSTIEDNNVRFTADNGIYVNPSYFVSITNNTIDNVGDDGIDVNGGSNFTISDNQIGQSGSIGDDGIDVDGTNNVLISSNNISNAVQSGVELTDADAVTVLNNTIANNGQYGLHAAGAGNGSVVLAGNNFIDNPVGARFESGQIDISNLVNPNSFINTNPAATPVGLQFDGAPSVLSIVDQTIGATVFDGFLNTGSFYARFEDGALLDPVTGAPQLINGLNASYDGFTPPASGILTQAQLDALESRIYDADDIIVNGRGQLFVGFVPEAGSIDNIEDFFNRYGAFAGGAGTIQVTISRLPYIQQPAAGTQGFSPASLNAISPAAGEGADTAEGLAGIEPAAGGDNAQEVSCWGDAASNASGGQASSFTFGGSFGDQSLAQAAGCSTSAL